MLRHEQNTHLYAYNPQPTGNDDSKESFLFLNNINDIYVYDKFYLLLLKKCQNNHLDKFFYNKDTASAGNYTFSNPTSKVPKE